VISDVTIPYATSTTLHAVHNDSITWYSDPLAQNMLQFGSYYTTPILFDTTTYYCQAGGGSIDSITTIFAQNNGSTGNMFDITTTNTITIDSFYINGDNSALMEVWYRVGTYVGHTSSNSGWIKLGDYTVTTAGVDQPTHLPIGGLTIPANQTYGIYVTCVSGSINYTNGTGTNQVYTDANMTITCGHGGSYFNLTNTPRVWNGTIFYGVGSGGGAGCPSAVKAVTVNISGIPHQDAGVEAVTEPSGLVNSGIPYDVKVKIKNHGIDTITKVTIGWDLDGTPKTSYLWTGSLPNDSVTAPITIGSESFTTGVHKIKAWTTMPNDSVDWANWNDTALANVFVCLEDTLTIGGSNPDFATIQDALAILDSVGVCGHTVFNIAPGTYTGQLTINPIMGASDSATVQFRSATGINTDVVLQYSASTTTDNWVVRFNSADYITFRDLTIKATNASYATVVEMINGATYNTIEGCLIQSTGTSSYNRGIYDYNTLNHYNTYKNNVITGGYYGMYIYGTSSSAWQKGTVIEGNEISDFYYYGILCYYQDSAQIIGNYIHDGTYSYSYGIYTYYNFNGFNISGNNISLDAPSYSYGLRVYYCNYYSYAGTSAAGLVSNNFISITAGTGTSYGLYAYYSDKVTYINNSIYISDASTTSRSLYQYNTSGNTNGQTFLNNIFANSGNGYAAYYNTPTSVANSDYNCFYSTASNLAYWSGAHTTLSSLQSASGMDAHSVAVNPGFVSATDLHVNNVTIDGGALASPLVSIDIDGDPRDSLAPDIGADEFMLIGDDAGVFSLVEPIAPCPGTTSDVKVELRNFGTDTLFSANIHWMVNTVMKDSVVFNDTLLPGASTIITLDTLTFYQGTLYNMTFWSSMPNGIPDLQTNNDTLTITGMKTALGSGTYTIGPDPSDDYVSFNAAVNDLNAFGICGPVVFEVDNGTYNESVSLIEVLGASAINTITFKSASGNNTQVTLTAASGSVFKLDGADYVTVKNISIIGTGAAYMAVEITGGAMYNTFEGNRLQVPQTTSSSYRVVYDYNTLNHFNTYRNNIIYGGYYGMYIYGVGSTSWQKGTVIEGNDISG
ncbi:hypothetical protein ACFLRZ_05540, partial [Bacteroidota bacterium]